MLQCWLKPCCAMLRMSARWRMPPATNLSKNAMFAVEVRLPIERDEELAAVGVLQWQPAQLRFCTCSRRAHQGRDRVEKLKLGA